MGLSVSFGVVVSYLAFLLLFSTPCYNSLRKRRGRTAYRLVTTRPWRRCWTWCVPLHGGGRAKLPCSCCSDRPDWWGLYLLSHLFLYSFRWNPYPQLSRWRLMALSVYLAVLWAITASSTIINRCIATTPPLSSIISSIVLCRMEEFIH